MIIKPPCLITARLLPGIRIGNMYASIEYSKKQDEPPRVKYTYHIDFMPGETGKRVKSYTGHDLSMGIRSLQFALHTLLSFLAEDCDAFPEHVQEWAREHTYELDDMAGLLDEEEGLIEEYA